MDDEARGKRLLVIFKSYNAYVDESGTHDGSPVVALAGYLSTYQGWNDFEDQWNRIMRRFRVNDFHMTDFETHHAEFEDNNYWTPDIRTRLMERVTALCQQKTTLGIGCAVIREQYDRLLSPKIRHDFRHPYYFCLYACLNMLLAQRPLTCSDPSSRSSSYLTKSQGAFDWAVCGFTGRLTQANFSVSYEAA